MNAHSLFTFYTQMTAESWCTAAAVPQLCEGNRADGAAGVTPAGILQGRRAQVVTCPVHRAS